MELSQVRYFITLCGTLNFTKAATLCNVTQPAFTRAIQKLEEELGGPLIWRERGLTQLTELGRDMRPHLTAMIEAADAATALAKARKKSPTLTLKIGLGPGIGAAVIAPAVREVTAQMPAATVQFDESAPASLIESMLGDRLDCALLPEGCALPERLNRWVLFKENAVAVLPPGHRLAGQNMVTAADIAGETVLSGTRCGGFAGALAELTGTMLNVRQCDMAVAQMLDLVSAGLGIALLPERAVAAGMVVSRRFCEPDLTREVLLTAVAGRQLNPAAANFVRLCRAQAFG